VKSACVGVLSIIELKNARWNIGIENPGTLCLCLYILSLSKGKIRNLLKKKSWFGIFMGEFKRAFYTNIITCTKRVNINTQYTYTWPLQCLPFRKEWQSSSLVIRHSIYKNIDTFSYSNITNHTPNQFRESIIRPHVTQADIRRTTTAEARILYHSIPHGICAGPSDSRKISSPPRVTLPKFRIHSSIPDTTYPQQFTRLLINQHAYKLLNALYFKWFQRNCKIFSASAPNR
jgi:hypothetical protein